MRRRFKKNDILEVIQLNGGLLYGLNLSNNPCFPQAKIGDTFVCEEDEEWGMVTVKDFYGNLYKLYSACFKSIEPERIKPTPGKSYLKKDHILFFNVDEQTKEVLIVAKWWFWPLILACVLAQCIIDLFR